MKIKINDMVFLIPIKLCIKNWKNDIHLVKRNYVAYPNFNNCIHLKVKSNCRTVLKQNWLDCNETVCACEYISPPHKHPLPLSLSLSSLPCSSSTSSSHRTSSSLPSKAFDMQHVLNLLMMLSGETVSHAWRAHSQNRRAAGFWIFPDGVSVSSSDIRHQTLCISYPDYPWMACWLQHPTPAAGMSCLPVWSLDRRSAPSLAFFMGSVKC